MSASGATKRPRPRMGREGEEPVEQEEPAMNRHHRPTQSKLRKKAPTGLKAFSSKGPSYNYNENASELFHENKAKFLPHGEKARGRKTCHHPNSEGWSEPVLFHI